MSILLLTTFTFTNVKVVNFLSGLFTRYFAYHGPDFLYRGSAVDHGYEGLPRLTFGTFYCMSCFSSDDSTVYFSRLEEVGCVFTTLSAFLHSFLSFLHSSLYRIVLYFTQLDLNSVVCYTCKSVCEVTDGIVGITY